MILAGDIGGTHTRLAFFEKGQRIGEEQIFPSQRYGSLEEILREFLKNQTVRKACFGVAGPVREGHSKITNLPWILDAKQIGQALKIPEVHLLNDLEANAYGLGVLKPEELCLLQKGKKQVGNQALIAAGTGLGEAGLFWDGKQHCPFATEGGHCDFAPNSELEIALFQYLNRKFGHVSYERVVSGPGLVNLYQFLIESGKQQANKAVQQQMQAKDAARVISEWGRGGKDPACEAAVDWFLSLYGREAGNMALKYLSLGGFYIGGGIAPHLVERMKKGGFLAAFVDKGRFQELLSSVPIWVVLNDQAALLGAAHYAGGL